MKEYERKREAHPCFVNEEACSFFIINERCKLESLPKIPIKLEGMSIKNNCFPLFQYLSYYYTAFLVHEPSHMYKNVRWTTTSDSVGSYLPTNPFQSSQS